MKKDNAFKMQTINLRSYKLYHAVVDKLWHIVHDPILSKFSKNHLIPETVYCVFSVQSKNKIFCNIIITQTTEVAYFSSAL